MQGGGPVMPRRVRHLEHLERRHAGSHSSLSSLSSALAHSFRWLFSPVRFRFLSFDSVDDISILPS